MTNEELEAEIKHLATKEDLAFLRADIHREFGNFRTGMQEQFGGFAAGMQKQFSGLIITIWITQLSALSIILVGVGLLIHFKL